MPSPTRLEQRWPKTGATRRRGRNLPPGLDHLSLVAANSPVIPELISWTQGRFGGQALRPAKPVAPGR